MILVKNEEGEWKEASSSKSPIWTGTEAELEAALEEGSLEDGTAVFVTDD